MNEWVEEAPLTAEQAARFHSHVDRTGGQAASACWTWTASVDLDGYGKVRVAGRMRKAHRVALAIEGREMPAGTVVDHVCRNRRCVRPSHLEVVTPRVNLERGLAPTAAGVRARKEGRCINGHILAEVGVYHRKNGRSSLCRPCHLAAKARYEARRRDSLGRRGVSLVTTGAGK